MWRPPLKNPRSERPGACCPPANGTAGSWPAKGLGHFQVGRRPLPTAAIKAAIQKAFDFRSHRLAKAGRAEVIWSSTLMVAAANYAGMPPRALPRKRGPASSSGSPKPTGAYMPTAHPQQRENTALPRLAKGSRTLQNRSKLGAASVLEGSTHWFCGDGLHTRDPLVLWGQAGCLKCRECDPLGLCASAQHTARHAAD
jgi:hypothetical protein